MKDKINIQMQIEKEIDEDVKQLKADLGILPFSDISQPEKFANMTMKEAEENIDDFIEVVKAVIKEKLTEHKNL